MAITLPTPLRVAAGIVASGIDLVRSLPEELPALPVTLVGKAMQLSMKVQQEIADLATKGDELLSGVLGGPQENPPWAHFDDEPPTAVAGGSRQKDAAGPARPGGAGSARAGAARAGTAAAATVRVAEGGKAPVVTPLARSTKPVEDGPAGTAEEKTAEKAAEKARQGKKSKDSKPKQDKAERDQDKDKAEPDQRKAPGLVHPSADTVPQAPGEAPIEAAPTEAAAEDVSAAPPEPSEPAEPALPTEPTASDSGDTDGTPADTRTDAVSANGEAPASAAEESDEVAGAHATDETAEPEDGPFALPDYDRMTLAQVRGYLRSLSAQEVQSLLDHEQSGENRAPFLTLLSNRLVTLEHQES